jgi:hypothetical protein
MRLSCWVALSAFFCQNMLGFDFYAGAAAALALSKFTLHSVSISERD